MQIRFVPPSPKAGTVEHCENAAGRALCLAGLAEEIKYTHYSQRLAAEGARASGAGNVDANAKGVEWGIKESDGSQFSQNVVIKKSGCNTVFYSAPPDDAPSSIKRRFAALADVDPNAKAAALHKAKMDAQAYNASLQALPKQPWE